MTGIGGRGSGLLIGSPRWSRAWYVTTNVPAPRCNSPRVTEPGERRSGVDRRRSNWREATDAIPPTARDALALRRCVEVIRGLVAQVDDLTTSPLSLRSILDSIELAIVTLDDALRPSG